jgi:hypothetical protein
VIGNWKWTAERLGAMIQNPIPNALHNVAGLLALVFGAILLSSCETARRKGEIATGHLTYSKMANRTPPESAIHAYLNDYWRAVSKVELDDDLQYKQVVSTSGLLGEERLGFQTGVIEIDYSISKSGVMKIENIRAPKHMKKMQISLARRAMQRAGIH